MLSRSSLGRLQPPTSASLCSGIAARLASAHIHSGVRRFSNQAALPAAKTLPAEVDVVVVGGGVVGASTCMHLAERGLSVLLLESHSLTAGTTWHTAGMLWRLRPSYVDVELQAYTREVAMRLEQEEDEGGVGIASFVQNGGLFVAGNRERLTEYSRLAETGLRYGVESSMLSPQDILKIHPLLDVTDVYGGLYSPTDGTLDPGLTLAYARAAKKKGAHVTEGVRVSGIETQQGGNGGRPEVKAVLTACGQRVKTGQVVNACGAWANEVARMAGVSLPLLAMKHAYVVTEGIEGMHGGLLNVRGPSYLLTY